MDVVELTNEVLEICGRQLFHNTVSDKLNEHIVLSHISDVASTRKLVGLLLLFFTLLLFLLTLALFLFASSKLQLEVLELHLDHLVDIFLVLLLNDWHHFFASHLTVILLLLVVAFVTVLPLTSVVFVELVKLLDNFAGSDFEKLVTTIIVSCGAFFGFLVFSLTLLFFLFTFLFLFGLGFLLLLR